MKRRGAKLVFVAIPAILALFAYLGNVGEWINPGVVMVIVVVLVLFAIAALRNSHKDAGDVRAQDIQEFGDEGRRAIRGPWAAFRAFVFVLICGALLAVIGFVGYLDWSQIDRF